MKLKELGEVLMKDTKVSILSIRSNENMKTVVERSERTGWMADFVGLPDGWLFSSVVGVSARGEDNFIICIDRQVFVTFIDSCDIKAVSGINDRKDKEK